MILPPFRELLTSIVRLAKALPLPTIRETINVAMRITWIVVCAIALGGFSMQLITSQVDGQGTVQDRIRAVEVRAENLASTDATLKDRIALLETIASSNSGRLSRLEGFGAGLSVVLLIVGLIQYATRRTKSQ